MYKNNKLTKILQNAGSDPNYADHKFNVFYEPHDLIIMSYNIGIDVYPNKSNIDLYDEYVRNIAKVIAIHGININRFNLYDFISLQGLILHPADTKKLEDEITNINPNILTHYKKCAVYYKGIKMITYYNKNYYTLINQISGVFSTKDKIPRMYQILVFYENIIYINLNAPTSDELKTGSYIDDVINILNTSMEDIKDIIQNRQIDLITLPSERDINYSTNLDYFRINFFKHYRIIISGCFNTDISPYIVNFNFMGQLYNARPLYLNHHIIDNYDEIQTETIDIKLFDGNSNLPSHLPIIGTLQKRDYNCMPIIATEEEKFITFNTFKDIYRQIYIQLRNYIYKIVTPNETDNYTITIKLLDIQPLQYVSKMSIAELILDINNLLKIYNEYPDIVSLINSFNLFRSCSLLDLITIKSYIGVHSIFDRLLDHYNIGKYFDYSIYNKALYSRDTPHNTIYMNISMIYKTIFKKSQPLTNNIIVIRQETNRPHPTYRNKKFNFLITKHNNFMYTQNISTSFTKIFRPTTISTNPKIFFVINIPKQTQILDIRLLTGEDEILIPSGIFIRNEHKINKLVIDQNARSNRINEWSRIQNTLRTSSEQQHIYYYNCTNCPNNNLKFFNINTVESINTFMSDGPLPLKKYEYEYTDDNFSFEYTSEDVFKGKYFNVIRDYNQSFNPTDKWFKKYNKYKLKYNKLKHKV
jgi:hypothetical protein